MKKIIYLFPVFILFSCGGKGSSEVQEATNDSLYTNDNEWIVSAQELKEKLGNLQQSFKEIGDKEVEETICSENATIPYNGNENEMNIWLMSTYMLDNFSHEEFGKNDFRMPSAMIRNETPLSELNWMNINDLDSGMFNIYRMYPGLTDIPKIIQDQDGENFSNDETVQKANMLLKALEDGLFGVVVITDYLPPSYIEDTEFESGYVMGYIMFADWQNEALSCITPFLAQNSPEINFGITSDGIGDSEESEEVSLLKSDLQNQTFNVIDSIARIRSGFNGDVWVNNAVNLERYKD